MPETTPTPTPAPAKKKQVNLVASVTEQTKSVYDAAQELATKLGVRATALVWAGLDAMIANPPSPDALAKYHTRGIGAGRVGTSPGYGIVGIYNKRAKRVTEVKVYHVVNRSVLPTGEEYMQFGFHSYPTDGEGQEAKQTTAMNRAIKAAQFNARAIGADPSTIAVEDYEAEGAEAA